MATKKRKKMGRPRVPDPRHWVLAVKVTKGESKAIRGMAAMAGLSVSAFILRKVMGGM